MSIAGIVLAGGKGSRMKSPTPKVLHRLGKQTLISYPIFLLRQVGIKRLIVVVGHEASKVKKAIRQVDADVIFAHQSQPLGTAHALKFGLAEVKDEKTVIVLNGDDSAFYNPSTIADILESHQRAGADMTFVTLKVNNPAGMGRVLRNGAGKVVGIVEDRAAGEEQKKINEINDGCYVFRREWIMDYIKKVPRSAVGEYYLTSLVEIGAKSGAKINTFELKNADEWFGIDTKEKLEEANERITN